MAGATVGMTYKQTNGDLGAVLDQLSGVMEDMTPVFREIGEYLDISTRQRFDEERAPDGTGWEPLKTETIRRKRRKGKNNGILKESHALRDLMRYLASRDGLAFGTDRIYGATQQFGDKSRGIPAREYLGLSEADEVEIIHILHKHLKRAMAP